MKAYSIFNRMLANWCFAGLLIILFSPHVFSNHQKIDRDSVSIFYLRDSIDLLMTQLTDTGVLLLQNGDYVKAKDYISQSLELRKKLFDKNDRRIGFTYVNLGVIFEKLWQYEVALDYYNKAEKIFNYYDSNYVHIGSIYVNKGIIYRKLNDFDKALDYYNNAVRIFTKQENIDYSMLSKVYHNIGIVYETLEEYDIAIENFEKSYLIDHDKSTSRLLATLNSLAVNYSYKGLFRLSEKYYLEAIELIKSQFGVDYYLLASVYMNYGLLLVEHIGNPDLGIEYYQKALDLFIEKFGESYLTTILCYNNIGEYYLLQGKIDSSLFYFQNAIKAGYPDLVSMDITSNPDITNVSFNPNVLTALKLKSKVLYDRYRADSNLSDLKLSLSTLMIVYDLIDKIRLKYDNEKSSFIISEKEDETYLFGIQIAYSLYRETNNQDFINIGFKINEKRKAFSLLTSIRKIEAKEFGGIPKRLLIQENEMFSQISAYEELIYEENKAVSPDENKIGLWNESLFKLNQEYETLIGLFEKEYPEYYFLKYDASTTDIFSIQQRLMTGTNLLEYAISSNKLYIFSINNKSYEFIGLEIDSTFHKNIQDIIIYLTEPNFSSDIKNSYNNYLSNAYNLYNTLISHAVGPLSNKTLVIIPDATLSYIPFEALLTFPVYSEKPDYRNLPYLLREYSVSYSYSATLHFEGHKRVSKPSKELLAFAPSYNNLLSGNSQSQQQISRSFFAERGYLDEYRDNLVPLPGIKDEVKMISKMVEGDLYIDDEATESNFKRYAGEYDILHLAMHTIVDNENPMYSKLAFTQNIDSVEDGFLNTYEIYNMRYNARMAVLSSCKTGYGKLLKGEGVMSLARGFMYAGCPSIIMTLWEVSDKSGAKLMQNFYKNLKLGHSKADALRNAKLDFLKKADNLKANPYFWSTYVAIGDTSPLYKRNLTGLYLGILLSLILLGSGYFVWRKYKKNKNESTSEDFQQDSIYS